MKLLTTLVLLGVLSLGSITASAQSSLAELALDSMDGFQSASPNWRIVGGVAADLNSRHDVRTSPGRGILVNTPSENATDNLYFGWEHGDLELEFEFMMPKESNSGLYLQGRYEIQLLDSWGNRRPSFADVGGIYQRWDSARPDGQQGFQGHAPRMNVARAPGLWQHLKIQFLAPRFDGMGGKIANARVLEVTHNGVVIHQNVELTGPTRGSAFSDEQPTGPLMLQGDHGPIALRNIRYARQLPPGDPEATPPRVGSIFVEPGNEPALIRGFMNHRGQKKTHTVAVGHSERVHYSMDLRQSGLMHIWKGDFLETTDMWHSRGQHQLATPTGSVIELDGAPTVARLASSGAAWPDTMGVDYTFDGYELDPEGNPAFHYGVGRVGVSDRLVPGSDGRELIRELTLRGDAAQINYWVRVASGGSIRTMGDGAYSMDDDTYLVHVDRADGADPVVRSVDGVSDLLVPVRFSDGVANVRYTLVW